MHSVTLGSTMRKAAFLALTVAMLAAGLRPLFAAQIVLPDGSTFDVELVSHGAGSYTYQVTEIAGKDLSHWLLGIGLCAEHLVSATPAGYELGTDGSTGYTGIKWNVTDAFTSGLFTINLDAEYPVGPVLVLAKAGSGYATGYVDGPLCGIEPPPNDPEPPADEPTPTDTPTDEPTATPEDEPTPTAPGETIPPPTATTPGGTIPPATPTSEPSATTPGGTIPPATSTPLPTATATATATQTSEPVPTCWIEIGDRIGNICTPTPTQPAPTATQQPPTATPTLQPDDQTPTPTLIPPTPPPTTDEDEGPEPTPHRSWLPIVGVCTWSLEYQACGW